jgi:hypothetical protein
MFIIKSDERLNFALEFCSINNQNNVDKYVGNLAIRPKFNEYRLIYLHIKFQNR